MRLGSWKTSGRRSSGSGGGVHPTCRSRVRVRAKVEAQGQGQDVVIGHGGHLLPRRYHMARQTLFVIKRQTPGKDNYRASSKVVSGRIRPEALMKWARCCVVGYTVSPPGHRMCRVAVFGSCQALHPALKEVLDECLAFPKRREGPG